MLASLQLTIEQYPVLVSVFSGTVSSAIFLFVLSRLKPTVRISNRIAFDSKKNRSLIKIINKSPFYKIFDVSVSLYSIELEQTLNGENYKIDPIKMKLEYMKSVQRFNWRHYFQDVVCKENRLQSRTDYAVIFVTDGDLRSVIADHTYLRFEVYAKHTLTGFAKIFYTDYKHSGNVIDGTFLSGNTFVIKS